MTQDEKWLKNEEKLMVNWQKQQRKLINSRLLKPERVERFKELQEMGGKYKRVNQYQ